MQIDETTYYLLKNGFVVKNGDTIRFNTLLGNIDYVVCDRWLGGRDNELEIIEYLQNNNLISESAYDYCSRLYGYKAMSEAKPNLWPECSIDDFSALSRVIVDIFELLNNNFHKLNLSELSSVTSKNFFLNNLEVEKITTIKSEESWLADLEL